MTDGHPDTAFSGTLEDSQSFVISFDTSAVFTKIYLDFANAAQKAPQQLKIEAGSGNEWNTAAENAVFKPFSSAGSGCAERMEIDIPKLRGDKIRVTVLKTIAGDGSFNIAELKVIGTDTQFKSRDIKPVRVSAKKGEKVVLPDTVEFKGANGTKSIPVRWEKKQLLCKTPGMVYIGGFVGTQLAATAEITVSSESFYEDTEDKAAAEALEELSYRGLIKDSQSIKAGAALTRGALADLLYSCFAIDAEYMPQRLTLGKNPIYDDTDSVSANELAALGILPYTQSLCGDKTVEYDELKRIIYNIFKYENDDKNIASDGTEITQTLCENNIISADRTQKTEAKNADALYMIMQTLNAVQKTNVYPAPSDSQTELMKDYTVKVNGKTVDVYKTYIFPGTGVTETTINGRPAAAAGAASFDFTGKAEVEITLNDSDMGDIADTVIRPLSKAVKPSVSGNKISFTLYRPCNLSIEPYGLSKPLQLFANPVDKNLPDFSDENVVYYGPGVHYLNPQKLKSGTTVYIDGGAVVYTKPQQNTADSGNYYGYDIKRIDPLFYTEGADVTIRGRGILSGRNAFKQLQRNNMMRFQCAKNAAVDGLVLLECGAWNIFVAARSDGVYINNVKMIGYFANNDGVDFCDSDNGLIENCYANNADDSFLIKSWGTVSNVRFEKCTAWNTVSTSFGAVCELYNDITDTRFADCTVIHSTNPVWMQGSGGVIGIWDNFAANIKNMTFENIVIEDAAGGKEPIKVSINKDSSDPAKKAVAEDILFKNISVLDSRDENVKAYTQFPKGIKNIRFENVIINQKPLTKTDDRLSLWNVESFTVMP